MSDQQAPNQLSTSVEVRPYTLKEMAKLYGVCARTLKKWLVPHKDTIGKPTGWFYSITQVKFIFTTLGVPYIKTIHHDTRDGIF